jgi:hypothetical protein
MSSPRSCSPLRRASLLGAAIFFAASLANAQSGSASASTAANSFSPAPFSSASESSSLQFLAAADPGDAAFTATPAASASPAAGGSGAGAGQEYGGGGWKHYVGSRLTFEAGGGFNAPIGNDKPYITWGGNVTLGGGLRFNKRISALLEYQYIDDKLPGAFIAAENNACQADPNCGGAGIVITAGNAHINSITASPVIDLFPKRSNGAYVVGGFGFYHKSTNFQAPELTFDEFGDEFTQNVTATSFTSNQWGGNLGLGIYHRVGGMYGEGHTQLFAESRYTYIHTPPLSQTNGLGTTELVPVTLGVRF